MVTNGTDAPVESINPMDSIYASVTRQLTDGVTFFPEQAMTRKEALRSYTIDCAYAAFEETSKGSLVAGKLADIVVLTNDLLNCPPEEIKSTKVLDDDRRWQDCLSSNRKTNSGMINRLTIFGVGLIGGSLALALKRANYCRTVVGCSRSQANLMRAIELESSMSGLSTP